MKWSELPNNSNASSEFVMKVYYGLCIIIIRFYVVHVLVLSYVCLCVCITACFGLNVLEEKWVCACVSFEWCKCVYVCVCVVDVYVMKTLRCVHFLHPMHAQWRMQRHSVCAKERERDDDDSSHSSFSFFSFPLSLFYQSSTHIEIHSLSLCATKQTVDKK